MEVLFVAAEPGPKRTDTNALALTAEHSLSDVQQPEIVVVPGGPGTRDQLIVWLRGAHEILALDHFRVRRRLAAG